MVLCKNSSKEITNEALTKFPSSAETLKDHLLNVNLTLRKEKLFYFYAKISWNKNELLIKKGSSEYLSKL